MPFSDYPSQKGTGIQVADIVEMEFLKNGVNVINRSNLNQILNEQKAGLFGIIDESTAPKIGKLLGVKAIMTGSVYEYGTTITNIQIVQGEAPAYIPISAASITLKLVDTETGRIVWSASSRDSQFGNNAQAIAVQKAISKTIKQSIRHINR